MVNAKELDDLAQARPYEEYLLSQWNFTTSSDYYSDHKQRLQDFDDLYQGRWSGFAKDIPKPEFANDAPLVENTVKAAVHDISALAHEARSTSKFFPRGDKAADEDSADLHEAICDTIYEVGGARMLERRLYMDGLYAGIMAVAGVYKKGEDYVCYKRLNPRYCYPDSRDGKLQNMLYVEVIKTREAARMFPNLGEIPPSVDEKCQLVDFYDDTYCTKGIIFTTKGKNKSNISNVRIVEQWEHKLKYIPVAFVQADTADGGMRGQFDQTGTALVARSNIIGFMLEYIESYVHAPFEEKNIRNADVLPGPFVVYHHDRTENESFMRRVAPAASAGTIFGLVQILQQGTAGETAQPDGRRGDIPQSQASGSYVSATQGRLKSVVMELQELSAELRRQMNCIGLAIEETWLDTEKPLMRSVGKHKTYTPSKDIAGWHHHKVSFGAAAGLNRDQADVRVLQFLGAKGISRAEMRRQIDFVDRPGDMQDEIDQEAINDAAVTRLATDPTIPFSILLKVKTLMKKSGMTVDNALEQIIEDVKAAEQKAQEAAAQTAGGPPAAPGAVPGEPAPVEPGADQLALSKGGLPASGQPIDFARQPLQTQLVRGGQAR